MYITTPFNNMRTTKFKAQCVFCYRQSNVLRLLPAADYCRTLFLGLNCVQRFDYRALDNNRMMYDVN